MVVARPADVGMEDRGRVRRALWRGSPVELVVEDGFDEAIGPGADLDGPFGSGLEARHAKGADKPDDAETGAIALLGMGPAFENLLAERRGRRADLAGVFPDALDRPAGVAPMAGGHMLGNRRVLPVPALIWTAMRSPLWKISTPRTVRRASTSARAKREGRNN